MNGDLFWTEDEHDRMTASDGVSRYGVYVQQRITAGFAECWDGTFEERLAERFAALAWQTATAPVMAPPYADWRSPVLSARFGLDSDSGSDGLIATVDIASRWPQGLHAEHSRPGGRGWYSWRRERAWGGEEYVRAPYEDEVARGDYYALTTVRLVFPVPVRLLPHPPASGQRCGEVEDTARHAVAALVGELNRVAGPVVQALERS